MTLKSFIGNRTFYKVVLGVAVPIVIQQFMSNFVNMLDNIMIGRVGTVEMTGASVANMLIFVFNLAIFGALSGISIFTAQYYGNNDNEGIRYTVRAKIIIGLFLSAAAILIFIFFGRALLSTYLQGEGSAADAAASLEYGERYLIIMLVGFVPFAMSQALATTLRETGETLLPMKAGVAAILVNLVFNYILIFGKLGVPAMGVAGAAIATVLSRFVELAIVAIWTFRKRKTKCVFIQGLFKSLRVPAKLIKEMLKRGAPLLANEILWSLGTVMVNQCYSIRSLDVMAAININSTIFNVCSCTYMAMGSAVGILVGKSLGAGDFKGAKDTANKLLAFSIMISIVVGGILIGLAWLFPMLYNTSDSVRGLASTFILINGLFSPFFATVHVIYFTLRSGGKTWITFFFDSVYEVCIVYPLVFVLSRFTDVDVVWMYVAAQATNLIKVVVGLILFFKGIWVNRIIEDKKPAEAEG
ncbi:MAG: MATE family efflux transporter [Parasporobacterium sp.]|nr:MATE family efflux transporter [Parasporobacterium sp.]